MRHLLTYVLLVPLLAGNGAIGPVNAQGGAAVRHPNLFLNREEIEQVRRKIQTQPWAAALLEKLKASAADIDHDGLRNQALYYALTGDAATGQAVRQALVALARSETTRYQQADLKLQPEFGAWAPLGRIAWAYDLVYDLLTPEERAAFEGYLRLAARTIIEGEKLWTTTPNLVFGKHFNVGLVGYCLGDKELIAWGLKDPGAHGARRGGFHPVLDTMINDGFFWAEAPIYSLHYDLHGMIALAEAALHYDGTDLYRYVSPKSGASIRSIIDGFLRLAYPLERTGIGNGSLRMATYGDGSTSYSPDGTLFDTFLVNPVAESVRMPVLTGELEIAYKRYKDPAYAWVLSLNPNRDSYITYGRAALGYVGLTHGEVLPPNPTPPAAPSGLYPSQGFALLRADESPAYWRSGAAAVLAMLGKSVGHGHSDYYGIVLHAKGRLLYPDLNVTQYEPSYLNWTREGICHNTLLVDHESPAPGPFTTRSEFTPEVKFFAISGAAYKGTTQTRALLLAPEYLADFFQAGPAPGAAVAQGEEAPRPRVFDWVLHGLGKLYPGNPGAYRPTNALVPFYWWIDNERSRQVDGTFQADWVQRSAGLTPGLQRFGKEWFDDEVGVRMTMVGVPGTQVYAGDGPLADGAPYHRIDGNPEGSSPLVLVRREAPSTLFAAVHEPYRGRPAIREVRRLVESPGAAALAITAPAFTDYALAAFDDKEHALATAEGEAFTFSEYAYVRFAAGGATVRGKVRGIRIREQLLPAGGVLRVNGTPVPPRRAGGFVEWGSMGSLTAGGPAPRRERASGRTGERANGRADGTVLSDRPLARSLPPPARVAAPARVETGGPDLERSASLHVSFLPEEAHLAAGGEKDVEVSLRCVGSGRVEGRMRVQAPEGISADPPAIAVGPMDEGQERVVRVKLRAAAGQPSDLHEIRLVPEGGLRVAPSTLLVSVGVVMRLDRRVPKSAQYVVRAPGYTLKVDRLSGVSYCLLDADGHRRHGRIQGTNFTTGFPGVERDGKWSFHYGMPCEFVWEGENTLTVGSRSFSPDVRDARLRYTFHDDRFTIELIPPSNPTAEMTVWLGNFDSLGRPRHNGTQQASHLPIVAGRFFFPHRVYRQGVLLTTPPNTPLQYRGSAVSFPLRSGQGVTVQFIEEGAVKME